MSVREQVIAQISEVLAEGMELGRDPFAYGKEKFPGVPIEVITDAWLRAENAATEKWWQGVEKTIEGEIIQRALAVQHGE